MLQRTTLVPMRRFHLVAAESLVGARVAQAGRSLGAIIGVSCFTYGTRTSSHETQGYSFAMAICCVSSIPPQDAYAPFSPGLLENVMSRFGMCTENCRAGLSEVQ